MAWLGACGGKGGPAEDLPSADSASVSTEPTPSAPIDDDNDGWPAGEDCDDADPLVHPAAEDPCDGVDQDCDGRDGDPATPEAWYQALNGSRTDLAPALSEGAPTALSGGGAVSVCGGA